MDIVNLLALLGARDKQKGEAENDFLHRLTELLAKAGYRGRLPYRAQVMLLPINTGKLPTDKIAKLESFAEKCGNDYCMAVLAEAKRLFGSAILTPEEAKAVIDGAMLLAKAGYSGHWPFRAQVMLLLINTGKLPADKMAKLESFAEKCGKDYCMAVLAKAKRLFGSAVLTPEEAKAVINYAIAGGKAAAPQPVAPKPPSPKRRVGRK